MVIAGGYSMQVKVVFLEHVFEDLKDALKWDGKEKAVYMLCNSSTSGRRVKLMPCELFVPEESDYVRRSPGYYEIDKPFINKVLNKAIRTHCDFVQVHIHPDDPANFSIIDEEDELKLMRHFAEKIKGIYHGSLVFGNSLDDLSLDGWFYDREDDCLVPIEKVTVVGENRFDIHVPPRSPLYDIELPTCLDRSIKAFGRDAVRKLRMIDFGVVGISALGAPMVEFLARDRVRSLGMCDSDKIEETNLNRLPFATSSDKGKLKVTFYERYAASVSPEMDIIAFPENFYTQSVQRYFSWLDIMFGCVDSGARLSMNRLAMANLIPYFDLGAGIQLGDCGPEFVGGQIYSIIPGRKVCLHCSGAFQDLMSEFLSPGEREREINRGYINEDQTVNPLVHFLDYTIAGLGYYEMLKYIWGFGKENIFNVHYNGAVGKLQYSTCAMVGCINCQEEGHLGKGDKVQYLTPKKSSKVNLSLLKKSLGELEMSGFKREP